MAKKLVLVVEDSPDNARLLSLLVEWCGAQAQVARDGREGLGMMRVRRPDLVLLDLIMPIMSGQELLAIMRADRDLREVPVVIISTQEEFGERAEGEPPHIHKPFDPAEVQRLVRETLGGDGGDT